MDATTIEAPAPSGAFSLTCVRFVACRDNRLRSSRTQGFIGSLANNLRTYDDTQTRHEAAAEDAQEH